MLKKLLIGLVVLSVCIVPVLAADAPAKSKKSAKGADWDVSMSLVDAIKAAQTAASEQYPGAVAYNGVLKINKAGKATYDIKFKISDVEDIKVTVSADDGKCKVAKKTSKVSKSSVKDKDAIPSKASKSSKKKKAAAAEEESEE